MVPTALGILVRLDRLAVRQGPLSPNVPQIAPIFRTKWSPFWARPTGTSRYTAAMALRWYARPAPSWPRSGNSSLHSKQARTHGPRGRRRARATATGGGWRTIRWAPVWRKACSGERAARARSSGRRARRKAICLYAGGAAFRWQLGSRAGSGACGRTRPPAVAPLACREDGEAQSR